MSKKECLISVVLPSLNVRKYVEECLDSVLNQPLKDIELICIDAGSDDGTWEILQKYAESDDRITVIKSDRKSYGYQVNMGFRQAVGKYISIVETDDYISPDMFSELYKIAERDKLDFVHGETQCFHDTIKEAYFAPSVMFKDDESLYGQVLDPHGFTYLFMYDMNIWRGIYNREFLIKNNIRCHETDGAAYQDLGFMMQAMSAAKRVEYVKTPYYQYRVGRAGASISSGRGLYFIHQEFSWLLNSAEFANKWTEAELKGIYSRMSFAYCAEMSAAALYNIPYDFDKLKDVCAWFNETVRNAYKNNYLDKKDFGEEEWKKLTLLLESRETLFDYLKAKKNAENKED